MPEYLCNCGKTFPHALARAAHAGSCPGRSPAMQALLDLHKAMESAKTVIIVHPSVAEAFHNKMTERGLHAFYTLRSNESVPQGQMYMIRPNREPELMNFFL